MHLLNRSGNWLLWRSWLGQWGWLILEWGHCRWCWNSCSYFLRFSLWFVESFFLFGEILFRISLRKMMWCGGQQLSPEPGWLGGFLESFSFYLHWILFRWGGMISTPDAVLQAMIKRSLQESGCPVHIVTELMENAHERRWPPGLQTLETRQMNRRWNFFVYLQSNHGNPNFLKHDIETDTYLLQAIWAIHSSEDSRKAGGGGDGLWQHTH